VPQKDDTALQAWRLSDHQRTALDDTSVDVVDCLEVLAI
jgi:hypothetical protein